MRRRIRGQSLIEFAFLAPVMMLLILGMIDLGRGFYYQTELTDAARDSARVLIAPASSGSTSGAGLTAACNEAQRDLSNLGIANVSCTQTTSPPPFTYSQPAANQATVLVYCGTSSDCTTPASGGGGSTCDTQQSPHTCVTVGVDYSFSILSFVIRQIAGPTLYLSNSATMVTLW